MSASDTPSRATSVPTKVGLSGGWATVMRRDDFDFVFSGGGLPFAVCAKGGPLGALPMTPPTQRDPSPRIHLQQRLSPVVVTPTAPRPIPRMRHQLCFHRIRVHVVQFLRNLRLRINVQIEIPPLPEPPQPGLFCRKCQFQLSFYRPLFPAYPSRHALLENLNQDRKST